MNMRATITPKSDQLNADDLVNTEITINITNVSIVGGDQPVSINYHNDNGRPYKPNKTMRKVMVALWGDDETQYAGRSMTLFTEPSVTWAGKAVGGLEIKAMSHIDKDATLSLTATRGKKRTIKIAKLEAAQPQTYGDERFNAEFQAMSLAIENGEMTAAQIIELCEQAGALNEQQKNQLINVKGDK
tara:strand:+ start:18992 stop:19552 length:561 start_codon:yes stop_codon:yes gene_type:complete